jgi:hypothetical protein
MKPIGLTLLALVTLALPAAAETSELKGAALLAHPATQVALENMSLMHAGKIEEAVKMGTKAMQADWQAMPDEDRKMMSEMLQAFSVPDAEFRADVEKFGTLTIDGEKATLVVQKTTKDENGSGTETKTVRLQKEDGQWRVTRKQ